MRCPRCGFGNSKSAIQCKECEAPLHEQRQARRKPQDRPEWRPHDGPISTKEYAEAMLAELKQKARSS